MSLAPTKRRGSFLNCRFAVNGIQKARRSLGALRRSDMRLLPRPLYAGAVPSGERKGVNLPDGQIVIAPRAVKARSRRDTPRTCIRGAAYWLPTQHQAMRRFFSAAMAELR